MYALVLTVHACIHELIPPIRLYFIQSGYQIVIESINIVQYLLGGRFQYYVIDQTFVDIPASALGQYSPPQTYQGEFHVATINLNYSLGCSPNYKPCSVNSIPQCVPEDECSDGKRGRMYV